MLLLARRAGKCHATSRSDFGNDGGERNFRPFSDYISTKVSMVNLAVFLFTTSEMRGRETIKISAASANKQPAVVDLLARRDVQALSLRRRKAQFKKQVSARLRNVTDSSVHAQFLPFRWLAASSLRTLRLCGLTILPRSPAVSFILEEMLD